MHTGSYQTSMPGTSRWERPIRFGLTAGGLIVAIMIASLLVGWISIGNLARYPGAESQAARSFSQQSTYQTSDDLPRVLRWYTRHYGLGHEMPQGEDCVTMTQVDTHPILQQTLAVTLCAQPRRTLIFVNRSLTVR